MATKMKKKLELFAKHALHMMLVLTLLMTTIPLRALVFAEEDDTSIEDMKTDEEESEIAKEDSEPEEKNEEDIEREDEEDIGEEDSPLEIPSIEELLQFAYKTDNTGVDTSAILWDDRKGTLYKDDTDGFWSGYPLEISLKENAFYSQFSIEHMIDKTETYTLEQEEMTEYEIELYESSSGTSGSRSFRIGIDTQAPEVIKELQLSTAEVVNRTEDGTCYYHEYPKLEVGFDDRNQSGVKEIIVSMIKNGEQIRETYDTDTLSEYELTDGIYEQIQVTAKDYVGNIRTVELLEENRVIVDTIPPEVTVEATVNDEIYEGQWTNQQIKMKLHIENCLSGIETVQYTYVPNGKTLEDPEIEWKDISLDDTDTYSITIGEKNWPFSCEKDDEPGSDIKNGEAMIGISPDDCRGDVKESAEFSSSTESLKNGTYYFVATSYAKNTSQPEDTGKAVRLHQRNIPDVAMYVDRMPGNTNWYQEKDSDTKPYFSFAYPQINKSISGQEEPSPLTLYYLIKNTVTGCDTKGAFLAECVSDKNDRKVMKIEPTEGYILEEDGIYEIYVWAADEAGNRSTTMKYLANADYTAPTNVKIHVDGDDLTGDIDDTSIHYTRFYKDGVEVSVSGDFDVSGFQSLKICEVYPSKDSNISDSSWHSFEESKGSFLLNPNKRCYFYAIAKDVAGNETRVRSDGLVVDEEAPVGIDDKELTIIPRGANENGFFCEDFEVDIKVQDSPTDENCAALKEVSYRISDNDNRSETKTLFRFGNHSPSHKQLSEAQQFEDTVTIKAADFESNSAYIEITAEDLSGNIRTTKKELKIDVTAPEITVTYDNQDALHEIYYKQSRTAKINIHELNFDAEDVSFEITKDGVLTDAYTPSLGSWETEGDDHYTYITFSEDGEYTLSLSYTDLAGNEAEYNVVDSFTIDTTKPEVTISYDNNTPWKEFYYNKARVATITVVEHNFQTSDFILTSQPSMPINGWIHEGDVHKTSIVFREDGEYTFSFYCMDLAGNEVSSAKEEHFKIDTKEPSIIISGVENESANSGEVTPVVTIEDEDFDADGVQIVLHTSRGKEITLKNSIQVIENGRCYTLCNVNELSDDIYYLAVTATDLAGNSNKLEYRFSLNRNGSTYDLRNISYLINKTYLKYTDISDLEIIEMNIDTIEKCSIYISRNGIMLHCMESENRPSKKDDSDTVYYKVTQKGNADIGYQYTYTIYKENFEAEGLYRIMLYSKDRAGNEVNNTISEKNGEISFVIDNTAPNVVIQGLKDGKLYAEDFLNVNVTAKDNFKLQKAEFYLVDASGNTIQTWNYLELIDDEEGLLNLTIPGRVERQSLLFYAIDEAGNEVTASQNSKDMVTNFLITTNPWIRFLNSGLVIIIAVTTGLTIFAGIIYFKKRYKR